LTVLQIRAALAAHDLTTMCERLHELAEELRNSNQVGFETGSETGT
ncbi:RNA polymerase, partial [Escherichia coli]